MFDSLADRIREDEQVTAGQRYIRWAAILVIRGSFGAFIWRPFPEYLNNEKPVRIGSLGWGNPPHDGFDFPTVLDVGIISSQELVESFVLV